MPTFSLSDKKWSLSSTGSRFFGKNVKHRTFGDHHAGGDENCSQHRQGGDGFPKYQPGGYHRNKGIEIDKVIGGDDSQKAEGFVPEDKAQGTSDKAQKQQISGHNRGEQRCNG